MGKSREKRIKQMARDLYDLEVFARVAEGWVFPRTAEQDVGEVAARFCNTPVQLTLTCSELVSLHDAAFASACALYRRLDDAGGEEAQKGDYSTLGVVLELTRLAELLDRLIQDQANIVDTLAVEAGGQREHTNLQ